MNFFQARRSTGRKKGQMVSPLMLPSIIHRTLNHLNIRDLLSCRQVNKLWREEATKRLQGAIIVRLQDWHSLEQFNRVVSVHVKTFPYNMFSAVELGQHICLADRSFQIALTKLSPLVKQLRVSAKAGPIEWRWLLFDQFSNITELHIHGIAPFQPVITAPTPETSDYRINTTPGCFLILAAASTSIPAPSSPQLSPKHSPSSSGHTQFRPKELFHLTKLSFNLKNRKSEDIFVRRFLRDIFSVVPNLRSLEWIKEDQFANDFQKTMFDCLMMKIRPEEGKLEVFKCPSLVCGTKELKDITHRMFPLKELHIQISSDVPAQCLEQALEAMGDTLQVLKLEFCPGMPLNVTVYSPVSNLVNLKEISLTEYRRSIGFIGYLPSLKKLTLTRTNIKRALLSIGWSFENADQTELSKSLETLFVFNDYLSREHGNCTREIVLKLAHCFPNLKAIRLEGLDDSSIRHLFKGFNRLEEVYAPGGTYSDEAFRSYTGKESFSNSGGSRSPNRYALSAFDASHLKNLRTLDLESIGLGDKFIMQGIINWRSLRNLTIKYCRISYPTLSRVLMELDLQHLSMQYCTILTDGILGAQNDPVEMLYENESLNMTYDMIQKWRFGAFRLLFEHDRPAI